MHTGKKNQYHREQARLLFNFNLKGRTLRDIDDYRLIDYFSMPITIRYCSVCELLKKKSSDFEGTTQTQISIFSKVIVNY